MVKRLIIFGKSLEIPVIVRERGDVSAGQGTTSTGEASKTLT